MVTVGEYDLERQIGAGASGTVWKAHSRGPVARVVALKRLRAGSGSTDVARLRREAGVLVELDHPHVVRVLEVLQDGDGIALAMQFAPGGSLGDLLAERGRLSPGQVVAIGAPVAEALASAHRRGVLHGDVKPANVLFTSDGEPLLTDFGVARTLGHLTSDQVTGTAEYLAPELLDGAQPAASADIYSLGVLCYQALAGHPPYAGPAPLAIVRAADLGQHPRLEEMPWVPQSLALVVERAMARDPAERYESADAFARALRAAVPAADVVVPGPAAAPRTSDDRESSGATRTFGPRPPRPETPTQRNRTVPLIVVIGLVGAGLIYLLRGGVSSEEGDNCPNTRRPAAEDGVQIVKGDPEGDGCSVYGRYHEMVVQGEPTMVLTIEVDGRQVRISLGDQGDEVFVGDWNCDEIDTPAVYRKSAGEVNYYDVWPQESDTTYQPDSIDTVALGGSAALDRSARANVCDRIEVTPPAETGG